MITLLGSLLGFLGSIFPQLFKYLSDKQDKAHAIAIMQLEMQNSNNNALEHLQEVETVGNIEESKAIIQPAITGNKWSDNYSASVRPTIAYMMFMIFLISKWYFFNYDLPWYIWNSEDQILFSAIISYYFGHRGIEKVMNR